jgi:hypothetical protein
VLGTVLGFSWRALYPRFMKFGGILFVVFGAFWAAAGFISYKSDIQLGIALAGINMIGIGVIMMRLANPKGKFPEYEELKVEEE